MDNKIKPAVDMDHAREITDGDMEFLKELIEIFKADFSEKLAEISRAIKEKDFNALDEAAHSLKGSSGNLGLTRVYEFSYKLEKMGKEENIEGANKTFKQLEEELERFKNFVSKPGWEKK
jgi:HPt (histidine-containing phosphotransfer) domain-containing protein